MTSKYKHPRRLLSVLAAGLALALTWGQAAAQHDIRGITGTTYNLYAFPYNMNLPEGSSMYMWGFGDQDAGAGATHGAEGDGQDCGPRKASKSNVAQQAF